MGKDNDMKEGRRNTMSSSRRGRCLMVINSLAGGGAERVFTTLAADLGRFRESYDFTVALLDDEESEAYTLPDWITVHRLRCGGSLLRSIFALRKLVASHRPDVSFSFLSRANFATVIACKLHGCRAIISERVNTSAHLSHGAKSAVSRMLVRLLYPQADAVIAVSQGVKDTLCAEYGVSLDKVTVIPNPFDVAKIETLAGAASPYNIGSGDWATMGRLVPTKNTSLAIRAFLQARSQGRLFVLGDGPLRAEIEAMTENMGAGDRVKICGFVDNPYAILGRCEGYLLPSDAEGFPNAMVEAMALSIPVVATDCPSGPSEILDCTIKNDWPSRGRGGLLVACGNVEMMARAISSLDDVRLRAELGDEARNRARDFSVERATQAFLGIIQDHTFYGKERTVP